MVELIKRRKTLGPWRGASKIPKWAYGAAGFALLVLSAADFVMLGDALGQSFGGWLGYVVVTALLAGFVFAPRLLAHYLHQIFEDRAEGKEEKVLGGKVVAAICCLLFAATLVGYVAVTDYRLSQAAANEAMREQASSQVDRESRIIISGASDSTKASAESQTFLLTAILVVTGVYSFALTWARESSRDKRVVGIEYALPTIEVRAMLEADRAADEHEADQCARYVSALEAVDSRTVAVEGAKVLLDLIEDPSESDKVSCAIKALVLSAEREAPLPEEWTRISMDDEGKMARVASDDSKRIDSTISELRELLGKKHDGANEKGDSDD